MDDMLFILPRSCAFITRSKLVNTPMTETINLFQGYYFAKPGLMTLPKVSLLEKASNLAIAV